MLVLCMYHFKVWVVGYQCNVLMQKASCNAISRLTEEAAAITISSIITLLQRFPVLHLRLAMLAP